MHRAHQQRAVGGIPLRVVERVEGPLRRAARIHHQRVEAPELGQGPLHRGRRLPLVADVGGGGDHARPVPTHGVRGGVERIRAPRAHAHVGAL